jgi:DNA-directed RNA polymerase specialized sigma24 family protein
MGDDGTLIEQLFSGGASVPGAWKEFLDRYSSLFLKVIWQFVRDRDAAMDTYLVVCTRFAANDFAILRKFRLEYGSNPPKFSTWLAAVVRNMCIDVHRSQHGRRRFPKALLRLSSLDRRVFEFYYWKGDSVEEIASRIHDAAPDPVAEVIASLERIEAAAVRLPEPLPQARFSTTTVPFDDTDEAMVRSARTDVPPEIVDALNERWLTKLAPEERLVVRLKFWEDMTAREIAGALGIIPEERVYSILRQSLKRLREISAADTDD